MEHDQFDEIDFLVARRIQGIGLDEHGCLDLSMDERDFLVEAQEEVLDSISYLWFEKGRSDEEKGFLINPIIFVLKSIYRQLEQLREKRNAEKPGY